MKKNLTDRQKVILEFIKDFQEFNGYPPTYREIGKEFSIASTFGVKRHIDALIKKGYLNSESNQSRTLSLNAHANKSDNNGNAVEIPILGRIAAGTPIFSESNIEGTLIVDKSLIHGKHNYFGLRVRGDSMINAGIFDGDLVIVKSQKNATNGEMVVAMLGDESTLKSFEQRKNITRLLPQNDNYSPINVSGRKDFSIIGKVVGVYRTFN
jgi:repressor LexA